MQEIDTAIETILRGGAQKAAPSRRAFPRYSASYPVFLEPEQDSTGPATGVTVNICRSGMLTHLDEPIASGTVCQITFLPRDRYRPELIECPHCASRFPILEVPEEPIRGTVVRLEKTHDGFFAALVFETLLDSVDEHGDAPAS